MHDLQDELRADLTAAMRARDGRTVRVLRSVLSAIANAEAVPASGEGSTTPSSAGGIAGAVDGLGAADVPRKSLSAQDIRAVVETERNERLSAADDLVGRGAPQAADDLRAEATLLERYLA